MTYSEAEDFLHKNFISFQTSGRTAYREGLEAITEMCRIMGNPQRDYMTIHIAGTNGKGSVAHMLASILQAAGYRTGLYTSPHLHDFRERIRIDGEPISQEGVACFFADYCMKMKEIGLSYFEMTTAMALKWFSDADAEVAVIETGLGGRLDATNIIAPRLSIITNIGLDHCDILGTTIPQIAAEKAGIIKKGIPAVIGQSDPESAPVFIAKAAECGSPLTFADQSYECVEKSFHSPWQRYTLRRLRDGRTQELDLDLAGNFQEKNLITVRAAVSALRHSTPLNISTRALLSGLRNVTESTKLRGRWQILSREPLTIADGGHNLHGFPEVVGQLKSERSGNLYMVIGFSADKDIDGILALMPKDAHYIFTQADSPRALPASELTRKAAAYGLCGEMESNSQRALSKARSLACGNDTIFIGGSMYLISEII